MTTDFDFHNPELFGPVAFRPEFNNFQKINATQAWSLLFTASREDKALGFSVTTGKFFTYSLMATALFSVLGVVIFHPNF